MISVWTLRTDVHASATQILHTGSDKIAVVKTGQQVATGSDVYTSQ